MLLFYGKVVGKNVRIFIWGAKLVCEVFGNFRCQVAVTKDVPLTVSGVPNDEISLRPCLCDVKWVGGAIGAKDEVPVNVMDLPCVLVAAGAGGLPRDVHIKG